MADDTSIKTAAKNFQAAANAFARLDEEVKKSGTASPSPDFDSALLSGLSKLMAAQAQESLWLKVVKGKMKSALIGKIAKQCSTDYAVASKALKGNEALYKQWGRMAGVRFPPVFVGRGGA